MLKNADRHTDRKIRNMNQEVTSKHIHNNRVIFGYQRNWTKYNFDTLSLGA